MATNDSSHSQDDHGDINLEQAALDDIMDIEGEEDGDEVQDENVSPGEPSPDDQPLDGSRISLHENDASPGQPPSTLDTTGPQISDSDHDWAGATSHSGRS